MAMRVLVNGVPTTVAAEEVYDALRCHHGGYALRDVVLVPAAPGQARTCAIAEYTSEATAQVATQAELWIDGVKCTFHQRGVVGDQQPMLREPDAVIEIGGVTSSHNDLFNALRQYADIVNLLINPQQHIARVFLRPEGLHALRDAIARGQVIPGIRLLDAQEQPAPAYRQLPSAPPHQHHHQHHMGATQPPVQMQHHQQRGPYATVLHQPSRPQPSAQLGQQPYGQGQQQHFQQGPPAQGQHHHQHHQQQHQQPGAVPQRSPPPGPPLPFANNGVAGAALRRV